MAEKRLFDCPGLSTESVSKAENARAYAHARV